MLILDDPVVAAGTGACACALTAGGFTTAEGPDICAAIGAD